MAPGKLASSFPFLKLSPINIGYYLKQYPILFFYSNAITNCSHSSFKEISGLFLPAFQYQ